MSKYRNVKTVVDGITFDSKREAKRYAELLLLMRAGEIHYLDTQYTFDLAPAVVINGRKRPPLRYVADFIYRPGPVGATGLQWIVEDAKGRATEGYRIKRHLMKSVHGIDIKEV